MSEQESHSRADSRLMTIIGLLKDFFLLFVSIAALYITYVGFVQNMPENKLQRERETQMKKICARAYVVANELNIYGGKAALPSNLVPSVFQSLKRNTSLFVEGLDEGIDLSLFDELMGDEKIRPRPIQFAATQYQLSKITLAETSEALDKNGDTTYIAFAVIRILDRCLDYDPAVFSDSVRKTLEEKYPKNMRAAAWENKNLIKSNSPRRSR